MSGTGGPPAPPAGHPVDVVGDWCRGWISPEPGYMRRASHAVLAGGGVWFVDPVDEPGMVDDALSMGPAAGVVQLLDRHNRDCAAIAARLGVPHVRLPGPGADIPFEVLPVVRSRRFRWHEVALWQPDRRALIVADALGTAHYFRARGEPVGPHPLLRLFRPPRALARDGVVHLLCGHGAGLHGEDTSARIAAAIGGARRRIPSWAVNAVRRGGGAAA